MSQVTIEATQTTFTAYHPHESLSLTLMIFAERDFTPYDEGGKKVLGGSPNKWR